MFCNKCGTQVPDGSRFCPSCGNNFGTGGAPEATQNPQIHANLGPTIHDIPKCTHCGNINKWKVGPIFRPIDWVIGIILLFVFILPGLTYFAVVGAVRSNQNNREKICFINTKLTQTALTISQPNVSIFLTLNIRKNFHMH